MFTGKSTSLSMVCSAFLSVAMSQGVVSTAAAEPPVAPTVVQKKPHNHLQWEKEVQAFEAAEKAKPSPEGAVLFIGSSTVRLWNSIAADFPKNAVISRGIGGCEIADTTHFAPRIVLPHKPTTIFLRAGGNDLHNGRSPEEVFGDYKDFCALIHKHLPKTKVYFISMCPTLARLREVSQNKELNRLVEAHAKTSPETLGYVDVWSITTDEKGAPIPSRLAPDKLHLSAEGYQLMAERVRPFMPVAAGR